MLFIIGSNATEAHPIIGNKMKQARAARRQAHRRRPAAHRAGRARAPVAAPQAGHRQRAGQRPAAHHHQQRLARPGLHRRALRGLRRPLGGRQGLPARARQPRSPACRSSSIARGGRALRDDAQGRHLLHARHHRAHHRHGQRHEPGQPRHGHRPHRRRERRRQPAARPEQRAGLLRHGRPAQLVPGLPERATTPRRRAKFSEAYGVPLPEKMGLRIPEMLDMAVLRQAQGDVHHGRGPGAHRRRRQPRAQGARAASTSWSSRTSS